MNRVFEIQACSMSVRIICALAAALILCASGEGAVQSAPSAEPQAGCTIDFLFLKFEHVDLIYDASGCAPPGTTITRVRIGFTWESGSGTAMPFTNELSGTWVAGIPEELRGKPVDIRYQLFLELYLPDNTLYDANYASAYLDIKPNYLDGTLQRNETITPPAGATAVSVGRVVVPAGLKLTLAAATYVPLFPGDRDRSHIEVRGDLVPTAGAKIQVPVDLYKPHALASPTAWFEVVFRPGSAGSTVTGSGGGNKFYVSTGSDTAVGYTDLAEDFLYIDDGAVTLTRGKEIHVESLQGNKPFIAQDVNMLSLQMLEGQVYSGAMSVTKCRTVFFGLTLGANANVEFDQIGTDSKEGGIGGSAEVRSGAKLLVDNSVSAYGSTLNLRLAGDPPGEAFVRNSKLRYGLQLSGGEAEITGNQISGGIALLGKSAARITNNAFLGPILFSQAEGWPNWGSSDGDDPDISNNSFLGPSALAASFAMTRTVSIGANHYGDAGGPRIIYQDGTPAPARFLGPRGATIQLTSSNPAGPKSFAWSPPSNTGPAWTDADVFPAIWLQDVRIGQNTLPDVENAPYLGKETLVSLDIVASQTIPNVRVRAEFDGVEYFAQPVTLYRDLRLAGGNNVAGARTTANIVLPVVDDDDPNGVPLTVYLDISGIPGEVRRPEGLDEMALLVRDLRYAQGQVWRPYRVAVVPVSLFGMCWGKGDAQVVAAELNGRLPDMFRLRPQDVQVTVLPPQYVYCSLRSAVSTTFMVLETVAQLAAAGNLGNVLSVGPAASPYDHVVGAMPIKSLGSGIDGANHPLIPRYVLVDTGKPSAVIHELGHAIGLYRSPEQYDQFPPDGLPLEGVTAFATADWVPLPGDKQRIAHFPRKDDWWMRPPDYHDVMGATDLNWPVLETASSFNSYFGGLRSAEEVVQPAVADAAAWFFLSGILLADPARPGYYVLDPPSIRMMDVSGHVDENVVREPYAGQPITWYQLELIDKTGAMFSSYPFSVYSGGIDGRPADGFAGWYPDYGDRSKAVRLQVRRQDNGQVVYQRLPAVSLNTPVLAPAAGSKLGDTLTIQWASASQPLTRYVSFSADNGATWQYGVWLEGDSITLPTEYLPSGVPIILRSWTSDGFFNSEQRVSGLTVANRVPAVRITSPADGAAAIPEAVWTLAAQAMDTEGGLIRQAEWRSSRDGLLGDAPRLHDVSLSPGEHTLTVTVQDSAGAKASASVKVRVGAVNQVDLALPADALWLHRAGQNPTSALPVTVTAGVTHTVFLLVDGAGAPLSVTAALTMTAPGGGTQLLKRETLPLGIFGNGMLSAAFLPAVTGEYRFVAAIELASLPDPDTTNNRRVWTFRDEPPPTQGERLFLPAVRK